MTLDGGIYEQFVGAFAPRHVRMSSFRHVSDHHASVD